MKRPIINRRAKRIFINHPDPLAEGKYRVYWYRLIKKIKNLKKK